MHTGCPRLYYRMLTSMTGEWTMKTAKPTDNELEMAIIAAEQDLESGRDAHHVAASLIYLYRRLQDLERVRDAAQRLVDRAQDEDRLADLQLALDTARRNELQRSSQGR